MTRHYIHGDPHEDDSGLYYCRRCDIFALPRHFDMCTLGVVILKGVEYKETHLWRYIRYWKMLQGCKAVIEDKGNLFWCGPLDKQKLPRLERCADSVASRKSEAR